MKTLSLLIKPASSLCSLRCAYCFYADVTANRQVRDRGVMRPEILELVVQKALAEADELCVFGFQGGEPTLAGLDFFRLLVDLEKKYNRKGVRIQHSIQTNGMCMDAAWADFFAENAFLVGLSIDAAKNVHDEYRRDAAGRGTHRRCLDAADILSSRRVPVNILSVVTRRFAAHPTQAYDFYRRHGFGHIQFIPCLDGFADASGGKSAAPDAKAYGRFLCRIFDRWFADFARGDYVSIRAFDNYVHMLGGHPPESCGMAGICTAYPLVEADGSVYPCDFYALDRHMLGNVRENGFAEMLAGEAARRFIQPSLSPAPRCVGCEYGFLCRGGCRRDRDACGDGNLALNRYCEAYVMFFSHALPRMRAVAARVF